MTGPLIYGVSEDAVAAAKVINDFAKTNDKLVIRAGKYEGKVLDKAASALATIPSREVLLARLLGRDARSGFRLCACSGRAGSEERKPKLPRLRPKHVDSSSARYLRQYRLDVLPKSN